MWERWHSRREMRAKLLGDVMHQMGVLSATKDRATVWQQEICVKQAHYYLRITLTHSGGSTTELEAVNGPRYGNEFLLHEFIAALGDRKGRYARRNPQEQVTYFRDKDYRLFD